ncbi:mobilization protein [Helicobacter pylori]|uniref:mobilization protein n=1 Tax=Helicobacter pylori TaxID=210 RepID=UPI001F09C767|nr:mobilization protein [Helicobacter pylori]
MGNLASGHFKPTNKIQAEHNDRTLSPNYLIPEEFRGQNEVNRYSTQARELKNQIIENAHQTYLITFKQKSQAKSYQWSLVVNTKETTTMSDLEKLAEHFEVKYGFQCYQIAIHRDEGYIDENNQPHINHHAHMEFITLNKDNGKNMWGQINQVKLRQIQTEIAQILGMERGTDKRVSGTERIEPRKYAQMKNKERKELEAKEKEISTLKQEKDNLKDKIQAKDKTINELNQFKNSSNLALDLEKAKYRIETLEINETTLKNDLNAKKSIIQAKEKELNTLKQEKVDLNDKIQAQEKTINELNKKLQELEDNYRLERERMVAENKRLKDQGLEKIYTQKDYEQLKEEHLKEVEALKKEIQKYKT